MENEQGYGLSEIIRAVGQAIMPGMDVEKPLRGKPPGSAGTTAPQQQAQIPVQPQGAPQTSGGIVPVTPTGIFKPENDPQVFMNNFSQDILQQAMTPGINPAAQHPLEQAVQPSGGARGAGRENLPAALPVSPQGAPEGGLMEKGAEYWGSMAERLKNDPALLQAGLMVLAAGMRRPELGQNSSTLFADGLTQAVGFYAGEKAKRAAEEDRDLDREQRERGLKIDERKASAAEKANTQKDKPNATEQERLENESLARVKAGEWSKMTSEQKATYLGYRQRVRDKVIGQAAAGGITDFAKAAAESAELLELPSLEELESQGDTKDDDVLLSEALKQGMPQEQYDRALTLREKNPAAYQQSMKQLRAAMGE